MNLHSASRIGTLLGLLLVACQPVAPVAPPAPALTGRLILRSDDHRYWEIALQEQNLTTRDVTAESFTLPAEPGASGFFSPDGRWTVTADPTGPWMLHSADGATRRPLQEANSTVALTRDEFHRDCAATWSPDGRWVAVLGAPGLYVAGVDSPARLVLARRSAQYATTSPLGQIAGQTATLGTDITCPVWLAPDALLADRFEGPLPQEFEGVVPIAGVPGSYRHEALDTSSIVRIDATGVISADLPARRQVVAQSLAYAVLRPAPGPAGPNGEYYLVRIADLLGGQATAEQRLSSCDAATQCAAFAFSDAGRRLGLLVGQDRAILEVWDLDTMAMLRQISFEATVAPQSDLYWSPRADAIAYTRGWDKPAILIVLPAEGRVVPLPVNYTTSAPANLLGWIE